MREVQNKYRSSPSDRLSSALAKERERYYLQKKYGKILLGNPVDVPASGAR